MKLESAIIKKLTLLILIFSVVSLFWIKNEVLKKKKVLKSLTSQVEQQTNNIKILESELAYLSRPSRIDNMSKKYLKLQRLKKDNIEYYEGQ